MNDATPAPLHTMVPLAGERPPAGERIAVIVIHGVADQAAFETPRTVIEQLQHLPRDAPARYSAFTEYPVTVPLGWSAGEEPVTRTCWTNFRDALRKFPHDWRRRKGETTVSEDAVLMDEQLRHLQVSELESSYRTTCASGVRSGPHTTTPVDMYEMYWADLSRLGTGIGRFFQEFYQLLFHLPWLGWGTVDAMSRRIDPAGQVSWWRSLDLGYRGFGYLLSVHVPLINVALLCLTLLSIVFAIPGTWRSTAAVVGTVAALAILGSIVLYRSRLALHWLDWIGFCLILAFVGTVVYVIGAGPGSSQFSDVVLLFELAGLIVAGVSWILARYGRAQPCAVPAGWAYMGILGLSLVGGIVLYHGSTALVLDAVSFSAVIFFILLGATSAALFVLTLFIALAVLVLWRRYSDSKLRGAVLIRRSLWTGLIGAAVPLAIFTLVTASIWVTLATRLWQFLPASMKGEVTNRNGLLASGQLMIDLVSFATMPLSNLFTVLILLALVMGLWLFAPSPLTDVGKLSGDSDDAMTREHGARLDQSFKSLRAVGVLMVVATMVVLPLGFFVTTGGLAWALWPAIWNMDAGVHGAVEALALHVGTSRADAGACRLGESALGWVECLRSHTLVMWLGGVLALIVGAFVALKSVREHVLRGLSTALDIALDVDNYIRKYPKTATVRARLVTRFVALLRHVGAPPDGRRYDGIVIVAHSQGSVIAVEALRLLERQRRDPAIVQDGRHPLAGTRVPPIYLATFGSPLRQLYLQRFPALYGYIDEPLGNAVSPIDHVTGPVRGPNPAELINTRVWVNGYRSADYVGRNLWQLESGAPNWLPGQALRTAEPGPVWTDVCVGAGAHNRYFSKRAPAVGRLIDALIMRAALGGRTGAPAASAERRELPPYRSGEA